MPGKGKERKRLHMIRTRYPLGRESDLLYRHRKGPSFLFFCLCCLLLVTGCKKKETQQISLPVSSAEAAPVTGVADCKKCILLAEQSRHRVAVADIEKGQIIWEWTAESSGIQPAHIEWFNHIDEAKVVYGGEFIITCASGGGIALIRIADKKTVFYAYAGGNTHSVEVLPDGNIVSASSTGNYLTVFKVDTLKFPEDVYSRKIPITFGHNVVWDHKNDLLWSAGGNTLYAYAYNFSCKEPDLILKDSLQLPGDDAHDLFPVYGRDALWFTNTTGVYYIDMTDRKVIMADSRYQKHIKSVSSGPEGFPSIIIKPTEKWWTDKVIDVDGNSIFQENGLKIYKARWLLPNHFSYPEDHRFHICT